MSWAKHFDKCQVCGRTFSPCYAKGVCALCYGKAIELRRKEQITRMPSHRTPRVIISKEDLRARYRSGKSLGDIARHCGCTRAPVLKLMKKHGIGRRSQSEARNLALEAGKISYTWQAKDGTQKRITRQKRYVNNDFFKSWTPAMAYVLGVVFTDGCVQNNLLSIGQKEPELLEKVRALMCSNHPLRFSPKRGVAGELYQLPIYNKKIYDDLVGFGLKAPKSRTIRFPDIPAEYIRHFLRGCWDGDGSIYLLQGGWNPWASYVSGSRVFIESLAESLYKLGLPRVTVYTSKTKSFNIKYSDRGCAKLYHLFYDGVDSSMCLTRKYLKFRLAAAILEHKKAKRPRTKEQQELLFYKMATVEEGVAGILQEMAALEEQMQGYISDSASERGGDSP